MSNFLEITSNDNWFKQHPEKIAGVEYETTSFYFPIMVKGTKEDVYRVTGISDAVRVPTGTDKEKRIRIANANARARIRLLELKNNDHYKIVQSTNYRNQIIFSLVGKEGTDYVNLENVSDKTIAYFHKNKIALDDSAAIEKYKSIYNL